jgi:hypothetical protein
MVAERLNFLAQSIDSDEKANKSEIIIKCEKANQKLEIPNKVEFYANGIFTEISTVDKYRGNLLEKTIKVNLYDLYNAVVNCDEVISFFLDEESHELVIGSFYNESYEYDELEIRLPYIETWFPEFNTKEILKLSSVVLTSACIYSILKELNINQSTNYFAVMVKDSKISFHSSNPGIDIKLQFKEHLDKTYEMDFVKHVPMSVFKLIAGSGIYSGEITVDFLEDYFIVETKDYKFQCEYIIDAVKLFDSYGFEDAFYIDPEIFTENLKKLNTLNSPSKDDTIVFEKVNNTTADLTVKLLDRYNISTRLQLAMLTETPIYFSGKLFQELFSGCSVDALCIKYRKDEVEKNAYKLYNKYENYMIVKEILYDHRENKI